MTGRSVTASIVSLVSGALVWLVITAVSGTSEAWDDARYWQVGYPLLGLAAFASAFIQRRHAWRWPLLLIAPQPAIMIATTREPTLLPVGLGIFAILAVPLLIPAYIAVVLARMESGRDANSNRV